VHASVAGVVLDPVVFWGVLGVCALIFAAGVVVVFGGHDEGFTPSRVILCIAAPLALLAGIYLFTQRRAVLIATEIGGGRIHVERQVLIGEASVETQRGPAPVGDGDGAVWIVNDTARPLRVESFEYTATSSYRFGRGGGSAGAGNWSETILPGATGVERHPIDEIGPRHRPGDEIWVDKHETSATRLWLTWDAPPAPAPVAGDR
jgi:hypothetical protein